MDPEGEPSAEDVVKVVDRIEEDGITVLFVEEYTNQSSVQSIVDQTGVDIQILYTMEMAPSDSSDDYLSMMNKNFDSLEAGMTCSLETKIEIRSDTMNIVDLIPIVL